MPRGKRHSFKLPASTSASIAKRMAGKALKIAKDNRKSIEVKEITTSSTGTVSSTGSVTSMVAIAEGDDISNRTGRKIHLKSLQIRGFALNNDLTTSDASIVRLMIIRDNSFGSTAPTIANVLQGGQAYGLRAQEVEKKYAVTVLYDKFMGLDVNSRNQILFEKYKKLNSMVVYDGTASTSSNKGALYLLLVSNRSSDLPTVNCQVRVRYSDA
jgi:hypothetical protein